MSIRAMTSSINPTLRNLALAALTGMAAFAANSANAALLTTNSTIASVAGPGPVGGTLLFGFAPVAFTSPTFSGTVTTQVIVNDPANPFGPGNLTFVYEFSNTGSGDAIDRMTVNGYGLPGLLTDVTYQVPGAGVAPTEFDRSAGLGDTLGFGFQSATLGLGVVPPGSSTDVLTVETNSPKFAPNTASFIDGSVVGNVPILAPISPTPEPTTLSAAALALTALLARRKH